MKQYRKEYQYSNLSTCTDTANRKPMQLQLQWCFEDNIFIAERTWWRDKWWVTVSPKIHAVESAISDQRSASVQFFNAASFFIAFLGVFDFDAIGDNDNSLVGRIK